MDNEDAVWEKVFMAGTLCSLCTFNEPLLDWEEEGKKRITRECVAARADYCPGVKKWTRENKSWGT